MRDPRLSEALPELLRDGLLDPQQAERIRAKYAVPDERSGTRMLLLLAILGSLLVGLGIILIVAHNWDDLPRSARTALAFLPVLLGQGLLAFAVLRRPEVMAWREGSALLLACGLCASVALISQIYPIHGELEGYLLLCCALILPLLYIPGSIIVALGYLALVLWHGVLLRTEHFGAERYPWSMLLLLLAAVPFYLQQARRMGGSIGFWWLSLFMAITSGVASQLFYTDWSMLHVLVMLAIASAYTLVPWLFPERTLRTWPWVLVGGLTVLILFFAFSFRPLWEELIREGQDATRSDAWALGILGALALPGSTGPVHHRLCRGAGFGGSGGHFGEPLPAGHGRGHREAGHRNRLPETHEPGAAGGEPHHPAALLRQRPELCAARPGVHRHRPGLPVHEPAHDAPTPAP